MSLKDEIDKLISSERALFEKQFAKQREFHEQQKTRFGPLRSALEEMTKAVDPAYVQIELKDENATVEVGQHTNNNFRSHVRWEE